MKQEKEIINGLKRLAKTVRPDQKWVEKNQAYLLAYFKENFPYQKGNFIFYLKPALVSLFIISLLSIGSFTVLAETKKSLPGSPLYSLKRAYEKIILKLVPQEEKPLMRTEIVGKRLEEVKVLAQNVEFKDSEVPFPVKKATEELKKEIISLKKEIAIKKGEKISDDLADLPIRDNRKIVEVIVQEDLEKLLAETKEKIKEKNFIAALEKINEVEKILTETEEEEVLPLQELEEKNQELEEKEKEAPPLPVVQPSLKTDSNLEKENNFKIDLIKE